MLKSLILLCLIGVSLAGKGGYRYLTAESHGSPKVSVPVTHHAAASAPAPAHVTEEFEKHFYYFNAPEEKIEHHQRQQKVLQQAPVKKNLKVIFIKAPEYRAHERAAHNLVQQATEQQQTHIYVLSKQPDHASLARKVQHVQQVTHTYSKPEVHFVKYHSAADAKRAQQAITQQYEALGGKSSHFDGGLVHVVSARSSNSHPSAELQSSQTVDTPVAKSYAKNFLPSGIDVVPGSSYIPLALRY